MTRLPPLIAIAEGHHVRPRKPAVARPKELELHLAVANLLRRFARADWRWGHYPAGEHRDLRTAAKLKVMGVQRGWADILLFDPSGKLHALELKRKGESLGEDQKSFREWCVAQGVPHSVARSVDEALEILNAWGVLRLGIGGAR